MTNSRFTPGLPHALMACLFIVACYMLPARTDANSLQVQGGVTAVYQQVLDTGADDISASGDLVLSLPTENGRWLLYIEAASGVDADSLWNTYPEINGDAGSVLDRDGSGHIQVSEFFYELGTGQETSLIIGQIDTSAHMDLSNIANDENTQFLGNSFVNNATIEFPDYTIGAVFRRAASEGTPELTLVISSANGIADDPTRSYSDLIDVTGDGNGIFAAAAARWLTGNTKIGAGIWSRTDDHPHLDNAARTASNHGAYLVYDRAFGEQSVNIRAGVANPSVSQAAGFASVAYERQEQHGTFGLGLARIFESSDARSPATDDTTQVEAWYRLPLVADTLHITANAQYIRNPGFDSSGTIAEANAIIAALRFDFVF